MFIPPWLILTVIGGFLDLTNETVATAAGLVLAIAGIICLSPVLLCSYVCEKFFRWNSKDWRAGLFTVLGGFAIYSLVLPLIVRLLP